MKEETIDYSRAAASPAFQELLKKKRAFIVPMTVFFLIFYFLLPILTSYFTFLNESAVGPITWAWIFAIAQFAMTWTLCILYTRKADQFDRMADECKREFRGAES